ncbi:MAG: DUF2752 domain-containing protein [Pirellulaceae bacterium]
MTDTSRQTYPNYHAADSYPLSRTLRWTSLLAGAGVLTLLITARILEPSAAGYGTHQQLGLPPCTSVALFNMRCPACGMTTSWALMVRGRWIESATVNAGGFLLSLIALAYLPISCYFFFWGRSSRRGWVSLALAIGLMAALIVAIVQWCVHMLE